MKGGLHPNMDECRLSVNLSASHCRLPHRRVRRCVMFVRDGRVQSASQERRDRAFTAFGTPQDPRGWDCDVSCGLCGTEQNC